MLYRSVKKIMANLNLATKWATLTFRDILIKTLSILTFALKEISFHKLKNSQLIVSKLFGER